MLFHSFSSQEERKACGGSDFLELQYCRSEKELPIQKKGSTACIAHWKNDSLYLFGDDTEAFLASYSDIFGCGVYHNGKTGPIDPFGINYYSPESETAILKRLQERNSADDRVLKAWLAAAEEHYGFYLLGV